MIISLFYILYPFCFPFHSLFLKSLYSLTLPQYLFTASLIQVFPDITQPPPASVGSHEPRHGVTELVQHFLGNLAELNQSLRVGIHAEQELAVAHGKDKPRDRHRGGGVRAAAPKRRRGEEGAKGLVEPRILVCTLVVTSSLRLLTFRPQEYPWCPVR